jgi:hypothetical protein
VIVVNGEYEVRLEVLVKESICRVPVLNYLVFSGR